MERLAQAGVRVSLSAAPLLPIRDIEAFARRARDAGARRAPVPYLNEPWYC